MLGHVIKESQVRVTLFLWVSFWFIAMLIEIQSSLKPNTFGGHQSRKQDTLKDCYAIMKH